MAVSAGGSLRSYFQEELRGLREDAARFAADHPAVARELAFSDGRSKDPQVELLMQSFAYLSGRLQFRIDEERATLPNVLLGLLYPHLQAPVPSMAVAQMEIDPNGADFPGGWRLARGRQVSSRVSAPDGRDYDCRLRTCFDTPLWPLRIAELGFAPTNQYDFLSDEPRVQSLLRLKIVAEGKDPIQGLAPERLRLHIPGHESGAYALYEMLAGQLHGVALVIPGQPARRLPASALRWLGFDADQAALPEQPGTHPAYRLLQEYFAFQEKFLFCEVEGLDTRDAGESMELLLLFDAPPPRGLQIRPGMVRLNCVPLVNLFSQSIDPLRLDHRAPYYRLTGDVARQRYCEIHTLLELTATRPGETPRPVAPYFSLESYDRLEEQDFFYLLKRGESNVKSIPGSELHVAFLDGRLDLERSPGDTIGGRALCTNRRLPEQLSAGDRLSLEGPGPVKQFQLIGKPTPHLSSPLAGDEPWELLSVLALNHLSLSDERGALQGFKRILALHDPHSGDGGGANLRQIDGVRRMGCRAVVRNLGSEVWRGLCRGEQITLEVDEEAYDGSSALLFGSVLRHFLALYGDLNTFTQLVLESKQRKETWKRWAPMVGAQAVL